MTTEYEYRRIDGSTSIKKRMDLVREFNRDPNIFIFLISTKCVKSRVLLNHVRNLNIIDTQKMSWEPIVYNSVPIFTKLKRKSWESVD